jgi:class 3 adenylate cyclase
VCFFQAVFIGNGDLHDASFNTYRRTIDFSENYFDPELTSSTEGHCEIILDAYPSNEYVEPFKNFIPAIFTIVIASLFVIMAIIFAVYNRFVQSRNNKVVNAAARSNAIVSSLFPSNVRDRLLAENLVDQNHGGKRNGKGLSANNAYRDGVYKSKPIADLFPETTVLFGDIVGFTAWSSVRDPTQVFTLLETVYHAFDQLAHKRRIFKVETIGDCYVAVCGLPEPNKNHAVNMARFAKDCMYKMWALSKKLEATLGPDTGDLTMRMGLHSGPVTAGVLRGERSRFQLFGDTVNTAARMESTGVPDRIQLSQETADLILAAGKSSWIYAREDKVNAKGKGMLQTYFLQLEENCDLSNGRSQNSGEDDTTTRLTSFEDTEDFIELAKVAEKAKATPLGSAKNLRLVEWNADLLLRHLKQIVLQRQRVKRLPQPPANEDIFLQRKAGMTVIDEVKEIIDLPGCDNASTAKDDEDVKLDPEVVDQLRLYMKEIGGLYQNNPFHNFEHASHVTMSVQKLLSRIVAPSDIDRAYQGNTADHTYGITSDPLTQFSCILSALIHDVDHPGVPNATLVKERTLVARRYKNKSVAEQNSVDLSWDLLMESRFTKLRSAIYGNDTEMHRFRQLIVNSVMATDIVDPEQKAFRNARWEKAFHSNESFIEDKHVEINRKATIVIEHLIQASDVSHMMQHWHIYRKWNERFFLECYQAYKMGRAKDDPSLNWYKGEIGFFDFYIIPLAKKLKECGVFGVSCDEYLNYAIKNRQEWEARGQEIVVEMIEKASEHWKERTGSSGGFNPRSSSELAVGTKKSFMVRGYSVLDL